MKCCILQFGVTLEIKYLVLCKLHSYYFFQLLYMLACTVKYTDVLNWKDGSIFISWAEPISFFGDISQPVNLYHKSIQQWFHLIVIRLCQVTSSVQLYWDKIISNQRKNTLWSLKADLKLGEYFGCDWWCFMKTQVQTKTHWQNHLVNMYAEIKRNYEDRKIDETGTNNFHMWTVQYDIKAMMYLNTTPPKQSGFNNTRPTAGFTHI